MEPKGETAAAYSNGNGCLDNQAIGCTDNTTVRCADNQETSVGKNHSKKNMILA